MAAPSHEQRSSEMEEVFQQALREAGDLHAEGKARIIEGLRLQFIYPGEFVAYVDSWKGKRPNRQLIRKVLVHGPSYPDFYNRFTQLPSEVRAKACIHYVLDPEGPLEVR